MSLSYDTYEVPFSAVFVAKRRSGKTILAEYIVNKLLDHDRIDVVYIFSKTCVFPHNWATINPKYKICDLNFKLIYQIMEYQRNQVINKKNKKNNDKNNKIEQVCFVFDDIIDSREDGRQGLFQLICLLEDLFTTGRHINISVMVLHQYIKHVITPSIRGNIDYMYISSNADEVLKYIKDLVIYKGNKDEFIEYINNNTNDNKFVVFDNVSKNNQNRWYIIKADINYLETKKLKK